MIKLRGYKSKCKYCNKFFPSILVRYGVCTNCLKNWRSVKQNSAEMKQFNF